MCSKLSIARSVSPHISATQPREYRGEAEIGIERDRFLDHRRTEVVIMSEIGQHMTRRRLHEGILLAEPRSQPRMPDRLDPLRAVER